MARQEADQGAGQAVADDERRLQRDALPGQGLRSPGPAQRFLAVRADAADTFTIGRRPISAQTYRRFRG